MTENDKKRVLILRSNGKSYAEISDITGLSRNSISAFCRRNTTDFITDVKLPSDSSFCKECGRSVRQIPHRKEKKFCSDKCRMKWWSKHPEMLNSKITVKCKFCGKEFHPKRKEQIYCSKSCAAKEKYYAKKCN